MTMAPRVLLIEDEANIAEAIRFILTRGGFEVSVLGLGAGAQSVIRKAPPQLVILDLMLPDMSGLEVLADLRADVLTRDVPVLMLTAKGHSRDRDAATLAGANGFMTKPFSNADMLAQVLALTGA